MLDLKRKWHRRAFVVLVIIGTPVVGVAVIWLFVSVLMMVHRPINEVIGSIEDIDKHPRLRRYAEFLPTDARDVHYIIRPRGDLCEARFMYTEDQFRDWMLELGASWPRLVELRGEAEWSPYDGDEPRGFSDAFFLTIVGRKSETDGVDDVLRVAWDANTATAYMQVCAHECRDAIWRDFRYGWDPYHHIEVSPASATSPAHDKAESQ